MVNKRNPFWMIFLSIIKETDSCLKLVVLLVLLSFTLVAGSGYFLRDQINRWIVTRVETPELLTDDMDNVMHKVLEDTGASTVTVWAVDLADNYRTIIYARNKDRVLNEVRGGSELVFSKDVVAIDPIVDLISENSFCQSTSQKNIYPLIIEDEHAVYVCAVSIPPAHSVMLGIIAIGFTQKPDHPELIEKKLLIAARKSVKGTIK